MKASFFSIIFLLCLVFSSLGSLRAATFDAYFNGVLSTSDVIGMGGAYRASANSISTAALNPAAVSEIPSWYSLGFTFGQLQQRFEKLSPELSARRKQLTYLTLGASFKKSSWKDFGFGIILSSPGAYEVSGTALDDFSQPSDVEFRHTTVEVILPMAYKPSEKWNLGIGPKVVGSTIEFTRGGIFQKEEGVGAGLDFGLIYKARPDLRLSFTYHFAERSRLKEAATQQPGFTAFRSTENPHRLFLGSSWILKPGYRLNFDAGLIFPRSNTHLAGSGLSNSVPLVRSGQSLTAQYFIGFEKEEIPGVFHWRVGHYLQPARVEGENLRFHATGGFNFYFWYIELSAALDLANSNYKNFTIGISPSFSHREKKAAFRGSNPALFNVI